MRGKSFVRMNAPGMHCSGPRPKSHSGAGEAISSPTLDGLLQVLPPSVDTTASCWAFGLPSGVLPLLKITAIVPSGSTIGSEPWSLLQACSSLLGSKKLPKKHTSGLLPLISWGFDQVLAWSVDFEK